MRLVAFNARIQQASSMPKQDRTTRNPGRGIVPAKSYVNSRHVTTMLMTSSAAATRPSLRASRPSPPPLACRRIAPARGRKPSASRARSPAWSRRPETGQWTSRPTRRPSRSPAPTAPDGLPPDLPLPSLPSTPAAQGQLMCPGHRSMGGSPRAAYCLTSGGSRRSCAAMLGRPFPGTNWTA